VINPVALSVEVARFIAGLKKAGCTNRPATVRCGLCVDYRRD
jgi:hypothetical protein